MLKKKIPAQFVRGYYEFLYSNKAILHENRMTPKRGQLSIHFISCNFRWPYQAKVMNTFETINNNIA